jgi:D-alanine transaminase
VNIVYLNGEYLPVEQAKVSVLDRGFLFADGVYEVIPIYHGKFFRDIEHLVRLENSLKSIKLAFNMSHKEWHEIFKKLQKINGLEGQTKAIYLQVTRGAEETRRHAFPKPPVSPTVFVMIYDLLQRDFATLCKGYKAITRQDIRWEGCYIKSISLLPNILARQEANALGANEVIFIKEGYTIEGATSNLFMVKNGIIVTPPKSKHMLGGITRELVLELARKHDLPYREENITKENLAAADEIWITSATRDVMPITQLDDNIIGKGSAGPVWQKMIKYFAAYKESL